MISTGQLKFQCFDFSRDLWFSFSYSKLLVAKLLEVSVRIDPDAAVKSDVSLRGDISLETCADSFTYLNRLIQYVAEEGDFKPDFESSSGDTSNSTSSVIQNRSRRTSDTPAPSEASVSTPTSSMTSSTPLVKAEFRSDLLDALEDDDFLIDTKSRTSELKKHREMEDSVELNDEDFDDFVDLEAEPGIGFLKNKSKPSIRYFDEFKIKENHFRVPHERKDLLCPPKDMPAPASLLRISELNFNWQMFAGSDFPITLQSGDFTRMDRTMHQVHVPKVYSAREKKTMVQLMVKKFKLRHDVFEGL